MKKKATFGVGVQKWMMAKAALLSIVAAMMVVGCGGEESHINVSDSQVEGLWVKRGTEEYWRYNNGHTGITWDAAEDISEEESNLTFTWSIEEDVLTHVFRGAMNNQAVPKVYTISSISSTTMKWKDDYGLSYTLDKVE